MRINYRGGRVNVNLLLLVEGKAVGDTVTITADALE